MSLLSEFKEFAVKGNMIDMATGIIIGASFNKIVDSLVNDVIMPPLGFLIGGVDFKHLYITLGTTSYASMDEATKAGAAIIRYGMFINTMVNFLIVSFTIFVTIKLINHLRKASESEKQSGT